MKTISRLQIKREQGDAGLDGCFYVLDTVTGAVLFNGLEWECREWILDNRIEG
jgi:hypothetical protein